MYQQLYKIKILYNLGKQVSKGLADFLRFMNGRLCLRFEGFYYTYPQNGELWRPIVHRRRHTHYMLTSVGCPICASCRFSIVCTRFIIPRTPCKLWGFVEDCGRLYNPLQDLCALVFSRCLSREQFPSPLRLRSRQPPSPPTRRDTAFPSTLRR